MMPNNEELIGIARRASGQAYSPYSRFPVGAAVLTEDGQVFAGCNVENASFGLAICAERVAIFNAIASGEKRIVRVAVSCHEGSNSNPGTLMPCGACRQVIAEFATDDAEILIDGLGVFTLKELLPHPFQLESS